MTNSRGGYVLKESDSLSLSDAAERLKITVPKCGRMVKQLKIPVTRIGYLVLLDPAGFEKLKSAVQRKKK